MKRTRSKVISSRWLPLSKMKVTSYYKELYPLPRDWSSLRESFDKYGYKPEYPITVHVLKGTAETFEIVCGVGRFTVAVERGMRRVPVIIRELDDLEARRLAIEDNLYSPTTVANISLVQAISLARVLAGFGVKYPAQNLWQLAKGSESTYWRAMKSLDYAISKASKEYPELEELEPQLQVAEMVSRDLFPDFTKLWNGEIEVNTFHQLHARAMRKTETAGVTLNRVAKTQSECSRRNTSAVRAGSPVEIDSGSAPALPESSQDAAKVVKRSTARRKTSKNQVDDNLLLFDFLE